jgi:hypothetical protein
MCLVVLFFIIDTCMSLTVCHLSSTTYPPAKSDTAFTRARAGPSRCDVSSLLNTHTQTSIARQFEIELRAEKAKTLLSEIIISLDN